MSSVLAHATDFSPSNAMSWTCNPTNRIGVMCHCSFRYILPAAFDFSESIFLNRFGIDVDTKKCHI